LIIVQNLPVPLDRRVWLECQALIAAGYRVSVICPKGPGDPARQTIDGVHIYKYAPPPATTGALSYLVEFVYCWLRTAMLSLVVWRAQGFDVVQACNPPDTYWALARLYRLAGKKFVYDQHDLNPEVFRSRFGEPRGPVARAQFAGLLWLERRTYRTADHVIVTNESYRRVAMERGGRTKDDTTVVRSGPNTARMRPVEGSPELKMGRRYLLAYLGIMGPQDGVDVALRVVDRLVHGLGREDVHMVLMGFGDSFDDLVALSKELKIEDYVTFTGRVGPTEIARYLSTADIGISPDPFNPLNDVSTMNKTMEYMSYAVPVVAFDLAETRISGGEAVEYVPARAVVDAAAIEEFAAAVVRLLDDPELRADMAVAGRRRAESSLDWAPQRSAYVAVFDRLCGRVSPAFPATAEDPWLAEQFGSAIVDVNDDDALREFAKTRRLSPQAGGPDDGAR
ncbi:MAG TPA: glycosyltransferase family 4 protein, partial [Jatrophihabitantaceae bacterium]